MPVKAREKTIGSAQPSIPPIFALLPEREVGIPVDLAMLRLREVMPVARLRLKESPGIPVLDFLAIKILHPLSGLISGPAYKPFFNRLSKSFFTGVKIKTGRGVR